MPAGGKTGVLQVKKQRGFDNVVLTGNQSFLLGRMLVLRGTKKGINGVNLN